MFYKMILKAGGPSLPWRLNIVDEWRKSPNGYNILSQGHLQLNAIKTGGKMAFGGPFVFETPFEAKLKDNMAYSWPFCGDNFEAKLKNNHYLCSKETGQLLGTFRKVTYINLKNNGT